MVAVENGRVIKSLIVLMQSPTEKVSLELHTQLMTKPQRSMVTQINTDCKILTFFHDKQKELVGGIP